MRIYLDDERQTPEGFIRCYWPDDVIKLLSEHWNDIEEVSLDHDLGNDLRGTGYNVVLWVEQYVHENKPCHMPRWRVHSQNVSGKEKMNAGLRNIMRMHREHYGTKSI